MAGSPVVDEWPRRWGGTRGGEAGAVASRKGDTGGRRKKRTRCVGGAMARVDSERQEEREERMRWKRNSDG